MPGTLELLILSVLCCSVSAELQYDCYPNDTIIVTNPMPSHYIGSYANNSNGQCTTAYNGDYTLLTVTGCGKNREIMLQLTNRSASDSILGGSGIYLTVIRCDEIASSGVDRELSQAFMPTLEMTTLDAVTPSFVVAIDFRSGGTAGNGYSDGTVVSSVTIGTPVKWVLYLPSEYYAQILQCTAYSGTSVSGTPNEQLLNSWCSQDSSLTGSFYTSNSAVVGLTRYYYTTFYPFMFYNSYGVYVSCDVKVCPSSNATNCLMDTCSKRRRRATDGNDDTEFKLTHTGFGLTVRVPALSGTPPVMGYGLVIFTILCWLPWFHEMTFD